jgi:alkylation response protein AidB-like acyl-CoA dehydrogenase
MDFRFNEQEEAFRKEVRQFLDNELPTGWVGSPPFEEWGDEERWELGKRIGKKIGERGWHFMSFPKEFGGMEASPMQESIYQEEMSYHRSPGNEINRMGFFAGKALVHFGTDKQRKDHLPRIAAGEELWCLGFSEPEAGSDLAALQTRAEKDGDDYVINGQKVWATGAQRADLCLLAARTDQNAAKHKGISIFLVDMKSPGITVHPLMSSTNVASSCEVFFQDVRVPITNLLGEENKGWSILAVMVNIDRFSAHFIRNIARRWLDELIVFAKQNKRQDLLTRHKLAQLTIESEVARLLVYRVVWMDTKGMLAVSEASVAKNFASDFYQHVANVGMEMLGLYSQLRLDSKWAPLKWDIVNNYLTSPWAHIYEGTKEINLNTIAIRGLGLPAK